MSPSTSRARALTLAGALSLAASTIVVPAMAESQGTGGTAEPQAQDAAAPQFTAELRDRHIRYGGSVVVAGRSAQRSAGTSLVLEFRPDGGQWAAVARTTTTTGGRYRLRADVPRNGRLRVVAASGEGTAVAATSSTAASPGSRELTIRVAPALRSTRVRRHVSGGRSTTVRGRIAPATARRIVRLQARRGGAWRTVDHDRTSAGGAYALRWRAPGPGRHAIRVRVGADRATTATARSLGRVNVYRSAHASWYGPGFYGSRTACGQTMGYAVLGVAHKSLPCGTRVTFRYRGRSVTVPVIDRGPFVAGREFDLTRATKARLGFGSTGNVQSTS